MSLRSSTSHDIVPNGCDTREFNTKRTVLFLNSEFVMVIYKVDVTFMYQAFLNGARGKVEICVKFNTVLANIHL